MSNNDKNITTASQQFVDLLPNVFKVFFHLTGIRFRD